MKKYYCSAKCYAAGEYQTNLYLAFCTILPLGIGVAFLSFQPLSNPSEFYIGVTLFIVAIFFAYSSICTYFPVIGRTERRKREVTR
jgi:amino acid transporter